MINPDCDAFNYVDSVCKLLKAELLFKDGTEQTVVYVLRSTSPGKTYKSYLEIFTKSFHYNVHQHPKEVNLLVFQFNFLIY